jgi:ubiquinol-cytochrome c reductase iron-sulfur subunit
LDLPARKLLQKSVRYLLILSGLAVFYVLFDFMVDVRPSTIQSSYRFQLAELAPNEVTILRQDNLAILVVHRSVQTIERLQQASLLLQDPDSRDSRQPVYALNDLRSRDPQYFVSYAIGTDFGCPLEVLEDGLRESCGSARYDLAGRALKGVKSFSNLAIPDYNFTNNFSILTIFP